MTFQSNTLLTLRRHRFDALHAFIFARGRTPSTDPFIENDNLRRDIGLPERMTELRHSGISGLCPACPMRR